jgi:hypothetical protein
MRLRMAKTCGVSPDVGGIFQSLDGGRPLSPVSAATRRGNCAFAADENDRWNDLEIFGSEAQAKGAGLEERADANMKP